MKNFPILVLALSALGFFAFGLWLLVDPVDALGKIGIQAASPTGLVELRAYYGGMELGLAVFVTWCALRPEWRAAGLWLVLLGNGAAGLARLFAIWAGGAALGTYLGWALAWELGFSLLAGLALYGKQA